MPSPVGLSRRGSNVSSFAHIFLLVVCMLQIQISQTPPHLFPFVKLANPPSGEKKNPIGLRVALGRPRRITALKRFSQGVPPVSGNWASLDCVQLRPLTAFAERAPKSRDLVDWAAAHFPAPVLFSPPPRNCVPQLPQRNGDPRNSRRL